MEATCLKERLPLLDREGLEVEDQALPGKGLLREGGHLQTKRGGNRSDGSSINQSIDRWSRIFT